MQEIWKPVVGYEGYYEVSNLGNVRSVDRICIQKNSKCEKYKHSYKGKILKQFKNNSGYMRVQLCYNHKSIGKSVHRLVAEAFIDNSNNYKCVNHINGIKTDNRVENLEFCTYSHNNREAFKLGLNKNIKKVNQYDLQNNFIKQWNCIREAERKLNILSSSISRCCQGFLKTAGNYKWRYEDE